MNERDAVEWAEECGWAAGLCAGPYSPPIRWGICPDADDAFITAYWTALAYNRTIPQPETGNAPS